MPIDIRADSGWADTSLESLAIPLPTHAAGDMLVIRICGKLYTNTYSLDNGWTAVAAKFDSPGGVAGGAGSGDTGVQAWYKEAASASETNPTLTVGGGSNSIPTIYSALSYMKDSGETWETPVGDGGAATGADSADITAPIQSHVSVVAGDMVDFFYVITDNTTCTVPSISQPGVTFDTIIEAPAAAISTTTGNDGAADGGAALALSGTSSGAATVTGTLSTSELTTYKSAWMTRLRVSSGVSANAEAATGAGTASPASVSLAPNSGAAAGAGSAGGPSSNVGTSGGVGSGGGAAFDATTSAGHDAAAEVASGAGSAGAPSVSIAASAETAGDGLFDPDLFDPDLFDTYAKGTARQPSVSIGASADTAGAGVYDPEFFDPVYFDTYAKGRAFDATVNTGGSATNANAEVAAGTGSAGGASILLAPSGGVGAGSGAAGGPASSVETPAGAGSGTGSAFDATVDTGVSTNAPAELAAGTGSALDASINVAPRAGVGAGTGAAYQPGRSVAPSAGLAAGAGVAPSPTVFTTTDWSVNAGLASGIGAAFGPTSDVASSQPQCIRIFLGDRDITSIVVWKQTYLESVAQGASATSFITIRDIGQTTDEFITGSRVRVDLGIGPPIYSGYMLTAGRRFWFPVDDPDNLQRQWVLQVADINILFSKRVVYKKSNPASVEGPTFTDPTYDDEAIAILVDNWLDLSADDIDTSSMIDQVAKITATNGQPTYPWQAGMYWGQAMATIAMLPAAIFYLDPDRRLVYADVDIEDAPFALSNLGPGEGGGPAEVRGYRESTIEHAADLMVNDFLALGFGKGRDHGVFSREQSAASIALHDLWQDARVAFDVYKQSTINRIADAVVNGSPSSKRGRKDDRVKIECVTHANGLRVGQKVRFINSYHDFDDVLPIRSMRMTFPTPCDVRYELKLSHDYDADWSLFDKLPYPGLPSIPPVPPVEIPDPRVVGEECECGITDTFTRTISGGWGTSDAGIPWTLVTSGGAWSTNGLEGIVAWSSGAPYGYLAKSLASGSIDITLQFRAAGWTHGGSDGYAVYHLDLLRANLTASRTISLVPGSNFGFSEPNGYIDHDDVGLLAFDWVPNEDYRVHLFYDNPTGELSVNVWLASNPEPSGWMLSSAYGPGDDPIEGGFRFQCFNKTISGTVTSYLDDLDISGLDACSEDRFDNFYREVTSGWGTSDAGLAWGTGTVSGATSSVTGTIGKLTVTGSNGTIQQRIFDLPFPLPVEATLLINAKNWPAYDGSNSPSVTVRTGQDTAGQVSVYQDLGQIEIGNFGSGAQDSGHDFSDPFFLKISVEAGAMRAKTWPATDIEPALWDVEVTDDVETTAMIQCQISGNTNLTGFSAEFDYIDFDYEDKPCPGCDEPTDPAVVIDNFDRTVGSGWGTASSGNAWSKTAVSGTTTESVDGDKGLLSTTGGSQITDMILVTSAYATGKDWVEIRWLVSTTVTNILGGIYNSAFSRGLIWYTDGPTNPTSLRYGRPDGITQILLAAGGGTFVLPLDDTPFWVSVRADFDTKIIRGKVWLASETEPDWNPTQLALGTLTASEIVRALVRGGASSAGSGTRSFDLIEAILPTGDPCTPIIPGETVISGRVCEDLEIIASVYVRTSRAMVANSSTVWRDGNLQRLGTEYTEVLPDQIVFVDDTIPAGTPIRVCYLIDPGGEA